MIELRKETLRFYLIFYGKFEHDLSNPLAGVEGMDGAYTMGVSRFRLAPWIFITLFSKFLVAYIIIYNFDCARFVQFYSKL